MQPTRQPPVSEEERREVEHALAQDRARQLRAQQHDEIGQYSSTTPGFEAMKSAAIAAGHAHGDAARRGSQIHLVSSKNETTSLLFRRPSSLERELAQAKAIHEDNRRKHNEQ